MTKKRSVYVCYVTILLNSAAVVSAASLNFQAPRSIAAPGPVAVIAADFNGDGRLDLFAQGWGAPAQVMLSNGDGTFRTVNGSYPALTAFSAVVADFNGDGKLDAAIASDSPQNITVLLGMGNGKFHTTAVTTNYAATGLAAGDVNGDGMVDLVVLPIPGNGVDLPLQVLLGKGNGTFQAPRAVANSLTGGTTPTLIDVNHDGILDLVYRWSGEIVTQLGNGDGTFGDPLTFTASTSTQGMAVADVTGDGKPDIVVSSYVNSTPSLCVYPGNGDGTYASAKCTVVPNLFSFLAVGDFNEDGHMDVAGLAGSDTGGPGVITVLLGRGDGTFASQANFAWNDGGAITVGDWNGDGHLDLAVPNGIGSEIAITLGDGHGNFIAVLDPPSGPYPQPDAAAADFNGDGKIDLAIVNSGPVVLAGTHEVDILMGNGDGTFQPASAIQVGTLPVNVIVADLNGDNIPDLIVTDLGTATGVWVLLGQGGGSFQAPVFYATPALVSIVARDVNGDGVPDLIGLAETAAKVVVLLGNGDGTFQGGHAYAAGGNPAYMALGHFHGGRNVDIAVSDRNGNALLLLPGNGNGSFGAAITLASGMGPAGIVTGDFNGDGMADLAVAATELGGVQVFLGNGDGTFQAPTSITVPGNAVTMVTADFDGDGNLDLAVTARYKYQVIVLLGSGNGQFHIGGVFDPGGDPAGIVAADFNGDGKADLLMLNQAPGEAAFVSILLNTSN